jgi:hypothetical protein
MSTSWAEAYQPVVYQMFMHGVNQVESKIPLIYDVRNSSVGIEYHLGMEGTDVEGWDSYRKTGDTSYADFDRGFPSTFTHQDYPRRYKLLKKYIKDNTLNIAERALSSMGISAQQKKETDAASVFNLAFTSGLGPDGVYLCSASHPYSAGNADTYSNTGTAAFSYTALKTARQNMRAWTDGLQQPLMRNGKVILHPIELDDEVYEIIEAQAKPGTADNDANAAMRNGGFSNISWDYLTDDNNWFVLDPLWAKQSLIWYEREPLEVMIIEENTTEIVYEFHMRYSYGWIDPRFVYGNAVT